MSIKKDETDNNSTKKKLSRKQKILISSIAILTGFSVFIRIIKFIVMRAYLNTQ